MQLLEVPPWLLNFPIFPMGIWDIYGLYMEVSINGGTPIAGWFIIDNPTKVDDN